MANALKDTLAKAASEDVDVDFSGAGEGGDLENVPAGDYVATVIECEPGESKAGNPKLTIKWELEEPIEGCWPTIITHPPTSGRGAGILRDTLRALDPKLLASIEAGEAKLKPGALLKKRAVLSVRPQKNDAQYVEVYRYKPVARRAAAITKKAGGRKLG